MTHSVSLKEDHAFYFMVILMATLVLFSLPSLVLVPMLVCMIHIERRLQWVCFLLGFVMVAYLHGVLSVSLKNIVTLNLNALQHLLFQHNHSIHQIRWWLYALPYSLIIASLLSFILLSRNPLRKTLRQLSRGQLLTAKPMLSEKHINKRLAALATYHCDDGACLGVDSTTGNPVTLSDQDANTHTLVMGTTGSGKTTTLLNVVESAIRRDLPLFYVDGKGDVELMQNIEQLCKEHNRPFYGFSMIGASQVYNPLASGGFTAKKDRIIALRQWSEEHYLKIAEGYLQTVFKVLERAKIPIDLISLATYLNVEKLMLCARECGDSGLMEEVAALEHKQKDISSLIAEIENIANSEIGSLFDTKRAKAFTTSDVLSERGVAYFCLQPLLFPSYAQTLGKVIINDLKSLAASQLSQTKRQTTYMLFDDFSTFAGEQIINLLNQGRGAGIHAILATQSLADIECHGGDGLLAQVLSNTNNYIIQRQNFPDDAAMLADIIGTKTQLEVTSQILDNKTTAGVGSVRQTREYIVHPDRIKQLKLGEAILVNKTSSDINQFCVKWG